MRPPTRADVDAILAVVHASDIAAVGEPDFTADEVLELLSAPNHDPERDSWVAVDEQGRIVGWAYIHNPSGGPRESFDDYVHPEHGKPAQPVLLDLVLARIAQRARERAVPSLTARAGAIATESDYIALLASAGFTFVKRYARMRRMLAADEPAPAIPATVRIRSLRPDDEADLRAFHEVLESAFCDSGDHNASTFDDFRTRVAAMPRVDWDEWLVAEASGRMAGILLSHSADGNGWVGMLGVDREFRGQGVGALLLRSAFHLYAAKGYRSAGLGVDTENPTGAYRLYESVGMHPVYEADMYQRVVVAQ